MRLREPTTSYTFVGSMDLREELQDIREFVSEREGLPASQSEVIRAALKIGLASLRKQRKANQKERIGSKKERTLSAEPLPFGIVRDPYDGPLPPGFVRKKSAS